MFLKRLFLPVFVVIAIGCVNDVYAAGSDNCACVEGGYCDGNDCIPCPAGTYCFNGVSEMCGGNTYQPNTGMTSCYPCVNPPYANENHTECVACDNVHEFVIGGKVCKVCPDDAPYMYEDYTSCTACNGVHDFIIDDRWCKVCSDFEPYINDSYTECVSCTEGAVVRDREEMVCRQCSGKKPYANEDHTECVACDNGSYIADSDGVCVRCQGGYLANADHTECVTCDDGDELEGVCYPKCGNGQYVNAKGECARCSAGHYVNSQKQCVECEAGNYCSGDGKMRPCSSDSFSGTGQKSCSFCPDGYTRISSDTSYVAGESLDNYCKKIEIKIKIGENAVEIPKCLKPGKINKRVIRQR